MNNLSKTINLINAILQRGRLSTSAKHRLEREQKRLERVYRARLERNQ